MEKLAEREAAILIEERERNANERALREAEEHQRKLRNDNLKYWEEQLSFAQRERNAEREACSQLNKNKIIV